MSDTIVKLFLLLAIIRRNVELPVAEKNSGIVKLMNIGLRRW